MTGIRVFGFAAFLFGAATLHAATIYDNGVQSLTYNGAFSGSSKGQYIADDFVLQSGTNTIRDVHWWGYHYLEPSPPADSFTIQIFADSSGPSGSPTTLTLGTVNAVDTGLDTWADTSVYAYDVTIAPITLTAGDIYWISIFNSTGNWVWSFDGPGASTAMYQLSDPTWVVFDARMAFTLTNDTQVPAPATLAMIGIGLAGLSYARRRKAH